MCNCNIFSRTLPFLILPLFILLSSEQVSPESQEDHQDPLGHQAGMVFLADQDLKDLLAPREIQAGQDFQAKRETEVLQDFRGRGDLQEHQAVQDCQA